MTLQVIHPAADIPTRALAFGEINEVSTQVSAANPLPVAPANITTKFRVAFEDPALPAFSVMTAAGDIVQTEGNAQAASYVSISKSPWDAGTETKLETLETFAMPVELAFGACRSQATLGQEFSFELVDTDPPLEPVADIAIDSITQATTPLIINSAASTNGQLVLTGTSGLQALFASNTGAAAAYVKLYNKATAPTVGTDVPAMIITVPAAVAGVPGEKEITPGFNGYRFALGLGLAITGGAADSDTTAVAAGQVKVILSRTA